MQRHHFLIQTCLWAVTTVIQLTGCTDSSVSSNAVSVSGTVEYKGSPVKFGMVAFSPIASEAGRVITTEIIDGQYLISEQEGMSTGKYKIVLVAKDLSDGSDLLPEKYSNAEKSNLELSISDDDTKVVKNFQLED